MNFKNRVVWLTGASSGIGEAIAKRLAAQGACLILTSRRESELSKLRSALANPDRHRVLAADLQCLPALESLADQAGELYGHIDVLVNNAGISQRSVAMDTLPAVEQQIMDLDFWAPVRLTKSVLPAMIERRAGIIINISSLTGKISSPGRSSYSAAKHALIAYMDCLRAEIEGCGVRIVNVCPGFVKTNISINALKGDNSQFAKLDEEIKNGISAEQFVKRMLQKLPAHDEIVVANGLPLLGYWAYRISPAFYRWLLKRSYGKQEWQK